MRVVAEYFDRRTGLECRRLDASSAGPIDGMTSITTPSSPITVCGAVE
jgi:hypothetical protein